MSVNMSTFPAQGFPKQDLAESAERFEPLLDSVQAAELLRIHPKTLQRMARNGEITATQVGKLWRFRASELDSWLKSKKRAS